MELLKNGPENARYQLVLAHGAGAGMDTPFMNQIAEGLAERDVAVTRFEFPYMAARRVDGKKRPPDRAPKLLECWREVLQELGGADKLFIGGKSMGGRMASLIATELPVLGVVCLGYPFHPPGKPEKLRIEHFSDLKSKTLICQGERDPFGGRDAVEAMNLPQDVILRWLPDGDHGLKPRKKSGHTEDGNLSQAVLEICAFMGV
ncbi:alpha/beta family hydrolase [Aestuariispira insulae]|uniref:KANL3/Tex30 alpha/beta hydrolase-like domain-containing protein n=1 Tax=Aestuariispira insulae TaxID=1461337 RepID=A0A3D9HJL1_9PROT|nr:alpha/beta family hydrolase [Aestuariispira insulae]RED49699.1 hypothetical protein DFP90_10570 [Aestuariispira insulae]